MTVSRARTAEVKENARHDEFLVQSQRAFATPPRSLWEYAFDHIAARVEVAARSCSASRVPPATEKEGEHVIITGASTPNSDPS